MIVYKMAASARHWSSRSLTLALLNCMAAKKGASGDGQRISALELVDDLIAAQKQDELPPSTEELLSTSILERCSPLMQQLLRGAAPKSIKADPKPARKEPTAPS
jgi:hypothetical protein